MIINEFGGSLIRSDNVYFANNEQASLVFFIANAENNLIKLKLLPPIWVAEIVECVRNYVEVISQKLQSLSPY